MKPEDIFSAGSGFLLSVLAEKTNRSVDSKKAEARLKEMEARIDKKLAAVSQPDIREQMQSYILEYFKSHTDSCLTGSQVKMKNFPEDFRRKKGCYLNRENAGILEECLEEIEEEFKNFLDPGHMIMYQEIQDIKQIVQESSDNSKQILNLLKHKEGLMHESGEKEGTEPKNCSENVTCEVLRIPEKSPAGALQTKEPQKKRQKRSRIGAVLWAACAAVGIYGVLVTAGTPRRLIWENKEAAVLSVQEELAYQQMEEVCGGCPVKMTYVPEGTKFLEADVDRDIQTACLSYLYQGRSLTYKAFSQKRDGSYAFVSGEEMQEERTVDLQAAEATIWKLRSKENGESGYAARILYDNICYMVVGTMERDEFQKILNGLEFA
ncbi:MULTISPECIES: DUF4367 domain-containing protein [unclassified Lactonifactor]|uniref:DUF4367 domain-containing protein n=1 Tax=unclassified Lactonifactor TaxID=2636670 RepID=UPI001563CDEF|nr:MULTISPECIES: DUF4367 domain-containing protein [unclassified Lactonifactor]